MDWSTHVLSRLQLESHIGFILEWGIPQDSHFSGENDGKPCGFGVLYV